MGIEQKATSSFWRNADGSWICTEPATLNHPHGRMQVTPGTIFKRGELFMGVDLALWLDDQANKDQQQKPSHLPPVPITGPH
jgi:hypothetical protein